MRNLLLVFFLVCHAIPAGANRSCNHSACPTGYSCESTDNGWFCFREEKEKEKDSDKKKREDSPKKDECYASEETNYTAATAATAAASRKAAACVKKMGESKCADLLSKFEAATRQEYVWWKLYTEKKRACEQ